MASTVVVRVTRRIVRVQLGTVPTAADGVQLGPDLTAIEALTGTGVARRTADGVWTLDAAGVVGLQLLAVATAAAGRTALGAEASGTAAAAVAAHEAAGDPHPGYLTEAAAAAGYQPLGADLTALEALGGTGLARRTAADTWTVGTTVSLAEGGTGATTRAGAVAALGTAWVTATPGATTDDVNGTTFATFSGLVAGRTYLIRGAIVITSVAGATAVNTRATASGGLVTSNAHFGWQAHLVTSLNVSGTPLETWTGLTAGTGAAPRLLVIHGHLTVTTGGDLLLQFRPEVAASQVSVLAGRVAIEEVA